MTKLYEVYSLTLSFLQYESDIYISFSLNVHESMYDGLSSVPKKSLKSFSFTSICILPI